MPDGVTEFRIEVECGISCTLSLDCQFEDLLDNDGSGVSMLNNSAGLMGVCADAGREQH